MSSKPRTSMFSFLFTLFLLCSSILASAIPRSNEFIARSNLEYKPYSSRFTPREASPLVKRDKVPAVPSVDDCKAKLTVPRDTAVFYSSAVQTSAEAWAAANGGTTIWDAGLRDFQTDLQAQIKQRFDSGQETWDPDVDPNQFFINCSKAFALLATGKVTAVLPAGSDGKPSKPVDSFFTLYELPILVDPNQTPDVTTITAYAGNTDGSAPSGDGEEICRSSS